LLSSTTAHCLRLIDVIDLIDFLHTPINQSPITGKDIAM